MPHTDIEFYGDTKVNKQAVLEEFSDWNAELLRDTGVTAEVMTDPQVDLKIGMIAPGTGSTLVRVSGTSWQVLKFLEVWEL